MTSCPMKKLTKEVGPMISIQTYHHSNITNTINCPYLRRNSYSCYHDLPIIGRNIWRCLWLRGCICSVLHDFLICGLLIVIIACLLQQSDCFFAFWSLYFEKWICIVLDFLPMQQTFQGLRQKVIKLSNYIWHSNVKVHFPTNQRYSTWVDTPPRDFPSIMNMT